MACSRVCKANAKSVAFLSACLSIRTYPSEQTPSGGMSEISHLEFLLVLVYTFRFWLKLKNKTHSKDNLCTSIILPLYGLYN